MKKLYQKIINIVIGLTLLFNLSCTPIEYATTQNDIYVEASQYEVRSNISFDIVIRYGTPYYYNGSILYYFYDGLYYYPYWYDNYWYVKSYSRPFNHLRYRPYFRPSHNDYRFKPGTYRGYDRPHYRPNNRPYNNHMNRPNSPRQKFGKHGNNNHMNKHSQYRPHNYGHPHRVH